MIKLLILVLLVACGGKKDDGRAGLLDACGEAAGTDKFAKCATACGSLEAGADRDQACISALAVVSFCEATIQHDQGKVGPCKDICSKLRGGLPNAQSYQVDEAVKSCERAKL